MLDSRRSQYELRGKYILVEVFPALVRFLISMTYTTDTVSFCHFILERYKNNCGSLGIMKNSIIILLLTSTQALYPWGALEGETEVDFRMSKTHKNYLMPKDIVLLPSHPGHSELCKKVQKMIRKVIRRHTVEHLKSRYPVLLKICRLESNWNQSVSNFDCWTTKISAWNDYAEIYCNLLQKAKRKYDWDFDLKCIMWSKLKEVCT